MVITKHSKRIQTLTTSVGTRAPVLDVRNLSVQYDLGKDRRVQAVDNVSFSLMNGKTLGIVGESGSGKTTVVRALLRIIDPPGRISGGQVFYQDQNLLTLPERKMRRLRSNNVAMIFQNPAGSLDPLFTIGDQFIETIRSHSGMNEKQAKERTKEALFMVGVESPSAVMDSYPTFFNAGMIQRIMIGMAISCEPDIILADEPTTTLGVVAQAHILKALKTIQDQLGTAVLLITHDMGVVSHIADDILVMYGGRCVEYGSKDQILLNPMHPYTLGLMRSVPAIDQQFSSRLNTIPGTPPDLSSLPPGCPFAPRCYRAQPMFEKVAPELSELEPGHWVSCHSPVPLEERAVV